MFGSSQNHDVALVPYPLWGGASSWFNTEVEGEFARTREIVRALGAGFTPDGGESEQNLELIPEPTNPHDRNAISVRADGMVLGYLARAEAARYAPVLQSIVGAGYAPMVPGRIWAADAGAYNDDRSRRGEIIARIMLMLGEPDQLVPVNKPPDEPYTLIPRCSTLQVTKEDEHFDVLRPYVASGGTCAVILTLHNVEQQLARSVRQAVEVRIDGQRCGQLGTQTGNQLLPAILHLRDRGLVTAVRGTVTGSKVAAEVTINITKAHELQDAVLNGPPITVPALGKPGLTVRLEQVDSTPRQEVSFERENQSGVTTAAPSESSPSGPYPPLPPSLLPRAPATVPEPDPRLPLNRYDGFNGSVVVQGASLWIVREGMLSKLGRAGAHLVHIPLSTVTGLQFRPANRIINGGLRIGTWASPVDSRAPLPMSDPEAVVFRFRDREQFDSLAAWLQQVVAANTGSH